MQENLHREKMKKINLIFVLVFFLTSCGGNTNSIKPTTTKFPETLELKITPSTTSTKIVLPTAIFTRHPSKIPIVKTPTPTPTPTITVVNITVDEKKEIYNAVINNIGNCDLPCFWDVHPGKTTYYELRNNLGANGFKTEYFENNFSGIDFVQVFLEGFDKTMGFNNVITFGILDGLVNYVHVEFMELEVNSKLKNPSQYSPENILNLLGRPDDIWIMSQYTGGHPIYTGYELFLIYKPQNLIIIYSGEIIKQSVFSFCPQILFDGQISRMNVYVFDSINNSDFVNKLLRFDLIKHYLRTISELGLSIEEVTNLLQNGNCFQVEGNLFP